MDRGQGAGAGLEYFGEEQAAAPFLFARGALGLAPFFAGPAQIVGLG